MSDYEFLKAKLIRLCKHEGLIFREKDLEDEEIKCRRNGNEIILNKNYEDFKAVAV